MDQESLMYAVLKKLGLDYTEKANRLQMLCPFHDDNTPSSGFYRDTHLFYCYVCECTLDAIQFYARYHNQSRKEAIKDLEKQLGLLEESRRHTDQNLLASARTKGEKRLKDLKPLLGRLVHGALGETLDKILRAYEKEKIGEDGLRVGMERWNKRTKDLTNASKYAIMEGRGEDPNVRSDSGRSPETGFDGGLEEGSRNLPGT